MLGGPNKGMTMLLVLGFFSYSKCGEKRGKRGVVVGENWPTWALNNFWSLGIGEGNRVGRWGTHSLILSIFFTFPPAFLNLGLDFNLLLTSFQISALRHSMATVLQWWAVVFQRHVSPKLPIHPCSSEVLWYFGGENSPLVFIPPCSLMDSFFFVIVS